MLGIKIITSKEFKELNSDLTKTKNSLSVSEDKVSVLQFELNFMKMQNKNAMRRDSATGRILKTK